MKWQQIVVVLLFLASLVVAVVALVLDYIRHGNVAWL